jgi:PAS domain S-box-containing protein
MRDLGARRPGDLVTQADGRGLTNGLGPVRDAVSPATFDGAQTYERSALLAGLLATALGVVVLAGWAAGLEPLKSFLPGDLPMKANAAVLLVLSGTTLTLQGSGRRTRVEDALAIVILGVATATALEYVAGVDLGIDRLLAPDVAQPGAPYAGRMAVGAVLGFAVTALALLVMGRSWRGWHPSAFLAIVAGLIGVLGILGYLYGASQLTSIGSVTQVAFPAALGLSVLAAGLVAADPEHGLMRLLRDPGLAGQLTRRLVPTIVLVLPVAGWLEIGLVQAGTLDEPVGVAAMVCLDILVLGGVGIWIAGGVAGLEDAKAAAQHDRDRVVDTSEDLIAATDVEGRLTLVSPSWTRDLGYAPDELLGHAIAEFIHPDDLAADGSAFLAAVGHAGRVSGHVNRGRGRDGTYRWLEWNSTRDPETGQLYVAGRDITRRKAADVALSESEERFRTLIESAPDAILLWDGELRCLEANRAACERLGYTRDEMLTMKATDISAPQGVGRTAVHAESIARTGSGLVETVHKRRDGTFIPVEVSSTVVRFGGRPVLLSIARDISARKEADARYRGLLEAAPDAMVVVDQRGEIVLLNVRAEKQFGYRRDELVGQPVTNIIPEGFAERIIADDLRSTADALAQVIGTGIELVARRKDGTEFPIEIMLSPLENAEGILVTAAIRDITARKAVEAALLQSDRSYRTLADSLPHLVWTCRSDGPCDFLSPQWVAYTGIPESEQLGYRWLEQLHPDDRDRVIAEWTASAARGDSFDIEFRIRRADGVFRWFKTRAIPLRDNNGQVVKWFGSNTDTDDSKRAETKLAQAEARYRGLLEAAPDAMVVVDGRGEIVLLNLQTETQFGYSRDELVGQPVTNIIPEGFAERIIADDLRSTADALAQVIGTGIELVALRKDGTEFPIEIMLSPLESAEGILVTAAIRDITARKAVEAEIRGLNTELEQRVLARTIALVAANAELEAFSYSVSHDLRAPLRSIAAFSQILLNEYAAPLDAEGRRIMAIVLRNVKQMGTLIEDLLAFSRVSRASLDRRPVDMARLARGVAEELGAACPGRVIAIDVGPLADVPGDAGLLRQVWVNLLGNAVKFTRPVEHATVEVRSERADGEFRFTVRDNGVGFDPAYLDKLFAPFSRLHATADFEGTGIGLAIVARIVARHGGRVWAEGAPGEGALFGFSIPEHLEAA